MRSSLLLKLRILGLVLLSLFLLLLVTGLIITGDTASYGQHFTIVGYNGSSALLHVGLFGPRGSSFTFYYSNMLDRLVSVSIVGDEGVLFRGVVLPGQRSLVGTLVLSSSGATSVYVVVSPTGGFRGVEELARTQVSLEVYASGAQGTTRPFLYACLVVLIVFLLFLPVLALSRGAWVLLQPPVYLGLYSSALILYYSGGPGVGVVDLPSAGFEARMLLTPFDDERLIVSLCVLATLTGALVMPYSRGLDIEAIESELGVWRASLLASRILYAMAGLGVGILAGILGLAFTGFYFDVVLRAGQQWVFLAYIIRDLAGAITIAAGMLVLASGLSYASRAPLAVLVVLVMLLVVAFPAPRFLGGGVHISGSTGGAVSVSFDYGLDELLNAVAFASLSSLAGILGLLVGWIRR